MSSILNSYNQSLDWLFSRFPSYQHLGSVAYKPGLDTISKLLKSVGNPQADLKIIHVAGTNGKGSTCAFTSALLQKKGYRVGLFTSPHIYDFRERIRVNGKGISEERVIRFCQQIENTHQDASFFEITLALALLYFSETNCDWVVLETGMGGRLDATNIVDPKLCIITSIGYDHQALLGDSLSQIATEKAGIIKTNVPIVCGESNPLLQDIFRNYALKHEAPFFQEEFNKLILVDLIPIYQQKNIALSMKGLATLGFEFTENDVEEIWPQLFFLTGFFGRLSPSREHPNLWYDVSHNEAGFKVTMETINRQFKGKLIIIYGSSKDKKVHHLSEYMNREIRWYFTEFKGPRSMRKLEFLKLWTKPQQKLWQCFDHVNLAIEEALKVREEGTGILITGSFFQLSEILEIQNTIIHQLDQ